MKKTLLLTAIICTALLTACSREKTSSASTSASNLTGRVSIYQTESTHSVFHAPPGASG